MTRWYRPDTTRKSLVAGYVQATATFGFWILVGGVGMASIPDWNPSLAVVAAVSVGIAVLEGLLTYLVVKRAVMWQLHFAMISGLAMAMMLGFSLRVVPAAFVPGIASAMFALVTVCPIVISLAKGYQMYSLLSNNWQGLVAGGVIEPEQGLWYEGRTVKRRKRRKSGKVQWEKWAVWVPASLPITAGLIYAWTSRMSMDTLLIVGVLGTATMACLSALGVGKGIALAMICLEWERREGKSLRVAQLVEKGSSHDRSS